MSNFLRPLKASRKAPNIFGQPANRDFGAENVAVGIDGNPFPRCSFRLLRHVGWNEEHHFAGVRAADPDALFPSWMSRLARFRVVDVQDVVLDEHAAHAAELLPLGDELVARVEDL